MKKKGLTIPVKKEKIRNFKQLARRLLKFLKLVKKLNVNLEELAKYPVFPTRPYMLHGSKPFLVAVNLGQEDSVKTMLKKNKFLIFQIDSVRNILIFFIGWKNCSTQSCKKIKFFYG